jgi:hypothetical protein
VYINNLAGTCLLFSTSQTSFCKIQNPTDPTNVCALLLPKGQRPKYMIGTWKLQDIWTMEAPRFLFPNPKIQYPWNDCLFTQNSLSQDFKRPRGILKFLDDDLWLCPSFSKTQIADVMIEWNTQGSFTSWENNSKKKKVMIEPPKVLDLASMKELCRSPRIPQMTTYSLLAPFTGWKHSEPLLHSSVSDTIFKNATILSYGSPPKNRNQADS